MPYALASSPEPEINFQNQKSLCWLEDVLKVFQRTDGSHEKNCSLAQVNLWIFDNPLRTGSMIFENRLVNGNLFSYWHNFARKETKNPKGIDFGGFQ